jgi:hypothetical protein
MLVTFKTDSYSNVTFFGNVALTFLRIMGHSGTVPGSISAADVPTALNRLSKAIESEPISPPASPSAYDDDDEEESSVSLRNRALPLIDLLSAAAASEAGIMWE